MRKLLISILLASAAASPALAQDHGDHDRGHRGEQQGERQQAREERQQAREQGHADRSGGGGERPQLEVRQQPQFEAHQQQVESADRGGSERRQRADGVSRWTRDNVQQTGETSRWTRDPNQRAGEAARWTRDRVVERSGDGDFRQSDRPVPNVMRARNPLIVNDAQRQGTRSQYRNRWSNGGWNRDWRNDRRYDWRRYRDSHRSIFRIGIYYDPFGYNYRPFDIGYRLQPIYFGQEYWFNPATYGLPYPPPGTQWVRYWNDAILVDVYSGEVVDVIHNFFW